MNQTDFPEPISNTATSLRLASGTVLDRSKIAAEILLALDRWSQKLETGFPEIIAAAEARSFLRGHRVEMTNGTERLVGIAGELDPAGGLQVMTLDGKQITIASGEVSISSYSL